MFSFLKVSIGDSEGFVQVYDETSNFSLATSFQAQRDFIWRIRQSPYKTNSYVVTASGFFDNTVKIWSSSDLSPIQTYTGHNQSVYGLEFINDDTIASGGKDKTIQIWSMSTGKTQRTINTSSNVYSLQLLRNGFYLAAGLSYPSYSINIYNINDGSLVNILQGHMNSVNDLALISDDLLASSSQDFTIRIWNLTTNDTTFVLRGHLNIVTALKIISLDTLVSASYDKTIKLWNITSGTLIRTFLGHKDIIQYSIDLLSDGQTLVSGSQDRTIKLWNITTGQCLNTISTDDLVVSLAILNLNITLFTTTTSTSTLTTTNTLVSTTKATTKGRNFY